MEESNWIKNNDPEITIYNYFNESDYELQGIFSVCAHTNIQDIK